MAKETIDHKCPTCGAVLYFNPKLGLWKCNYCDNEYTLNDLQKYNNASSVDNNNLEEDYNFSSYICKDCGAEIIADDNTSATFCVYCGNTAILKNKLSGKFAPSKVIPFKKEKEDAVKAFKALSKGRPLMPKSFNTIENIEKIRGIYIPFWLFDIKVEGSLNVDAKTIHTYISGNREYTKTDVYKCFRTGSMEYDDIPVDGSLHFDNDIMNTLEPFNYNEMVDYNHAYLSGFLAEKYDVESDNAFNIANHRAVNSTKDTIYNSIGSYSFKTISENTLQGTLQTCKYALLPVWMVNVKYKDKTYIFAMNGQTGKFIGDIPLDKEKYRIYTISIFVFTFLLVILISYIFYLITGGSV